MSVSHTSFELYCGYHHEQSFKDTVDLRLGSCFANKLVKELKELISICQQNLLHAQQLQKCAYNKDIKPCSCTLGKKIWLCGKYIKTKRNWKLEAKFFRSFQVFHPVHKQAYRLELLANSKIHDLFHMLLWESDTTKKGQVNEFLKLELNAEKFKEYEIETMSNCAVYNKTAKD